MADTVTTLQTKVRWEARDQEFSLTDATGLVVVNAAYRRLASLVHWPELHRTDTSATTTANQEAVTWPSVSFIDVTSVELQNPDDDLNYRFIPPATTELEWSIARAKEAGFPEMYKRLHDGTQNVMLLAPAPCVALTVRISGQIEPAEVTAAAATTVFISTTPDDVLSYLIAADVADKRGQPNRAQALYGKAAEVLSALSGQEITPAELKART